jgi:hypothetical protein
MDLLSLMDNDTILCKELGDDFKIINNLYFCFIRDGVFYNVIEKVKSKDEYTFIELPFDEIKQGLKNNYKFGYVVFFKGIKYIWEFDKKDIMIQYAFDGNKNDYKYISVFTRNFKLL